MEYSRHERSISGLLCCKDISKLLAKFWLYKTNKSWSSMRKDFNYPCHLSLRNIGNWPYIRADFGFAPADERWHYLKDWSRSGGSCGNNSGTGTSLRSRDVLAQDNKSLGCCCRNSLPTVINPDYNMTKQLCMKRIYDKIRSKSPSNRATSPTCLHCDITHLSLTTGVVALHIPSWRVEVREERRQARKIVWPVNAGRVICRYQNNLCGIINHHKHIRECFLDV